MYKDDNLTKSACNESLLRMMINGTPLSPTRDIPQPNGSCTNATGTLGVRERPLSMVYSPLQEFDNLYDLDTALNQGTLFAELDLPFMGRTIQKGGNCRG